MEEKLAELAAAEGCSLIKVGPQKYVLHRKVLEENDLLALSKRFKKIVRPSPLHDLFLTKTLTLMNSVYFMDDEFIKMSQDVYPIEFSDYKDYHQVIIGQSPFASISIDKKNLRLEIEHELKGLWMKLRSFYISSNGCSKFLGKTLSGALETITVYSRATLRLAGSEIPTKKPAKDLAIFETLSDKAKLSLKTLIALKSDKKLRKVSPEEYLQALLEIKSIICFVDNFNSTGK